MPLSPNAGAQLWGGSQRREINKAVGKGPHDKEGQMESHSTEQAVTVIPLPNLLSDSRAEISGMDWYGDELILMPHP